jgi:xanthine dehydrogenase accessory factor
MVHVGEIVAYVNNLPVQAQLDGIVRGLLHADLRIKTGMKVGDIDPRAVLSHCYTISDKSLAVAGGVLEAILTLRNLLDNHQGYK